MMMIAVLMQHQQQDKTLPICRTSWLPDRPAMLLDLKDVVEQQRGTTQLTLRVVLPRNRTTALLILKVDP